MHSETLPAPDGAPTRAPRGLKLAGIVAGVAAIGIVAAGTLSRSHDTGAAQQWSDARSIPVVRLVSVKGTAADGSLTLPGTMAAWNAAKLYARVAGYVRSWRVDIGAPVTAGEPLATIDTPELDQQIVQARADLASARAHAVLAKSTAVRWNDLLSTRSVSQQEADEKNGELAVSNAAVGGAAANLGRLMAMKALATVRSPFAGVVTSRNAEIGDLVGPGSGATKPIFAIADLGRIRIYVDVPQSYSAVIHPGETATLSVPDYPDRRFVARVAGTSGAIDGQSGAFQVQLVTDNPGDVLKPGGYAQVRFDAPAQAGTVQIPSSTLIFHTNGTQVATIGPDGRVHLHRITIGRDMGQTVEVTRGLSASDRIVDNPPDSIAEGELVRVQRGDHA